MNAVIIHRSERTDREEFLLPLIRTFKGARILEAVVPPRNNLSYEQAIVGCAASHLQAVATDLGEQQPLVVLEDDAVIDPVLLSSCFSITPPPRDCGAILLGGDGLPEPKGDWTEIVRPFFGTQAVVYLPALKKTPFLLLAYRQLALSQVGKTTDGSIGLCYESVLLTAIRASGLKLYRPSCLPATTHESISDRTGQLHAARENSPTMTQEAP